MQPPAEHVHWMFATGVLFLGLCLMAQAIVGETQWRNALPWWLVLVHVALAAAVWSLTVALVAMIWRPPAWLAPARS